MKEIRICMPTAAKSALTNVVYFKDLLGIVRFITGTAISLSKMH